MWTFKEINGFTCQIKHFDEPSEDFGINGGRISKLWIGKGRKGYAHYERGWDIKPTTKEAKAVYESLVKEFN